MVSFTVKHYGLVSGVTTDITNDIVALPLFTDTGSGEVNTAIITLSGDAGKYVVTSPIIDQFDQIWIQATDDSGNNFGRTGGGVVYEVRKIIPQETKDGGNKLELQCAGIEANLQVMDYATPWWFTDSFTVGKDIGVFYNAVKGSNQPLLLSHDDPAFNKLPNWTTNIYDFGLNEDKCYNRLMEVVDKLGSSVDAGGALDFYDVGFTTALNTMQINIFSSGSNPPSPITISGPTNAVNLGESKGGIDSQQGSLICSWGANGLGSLPTSYSKFASKEYFYPLYKQWDNSVTYPVGARIQYKGLLYQALAQNNNVQPDTHPGTWLPSSRATEYGNQIAYSPWTTAGVSYWRNSGSNLSNQGNSNTEPFGFSMWDGNLILNNDVSVFRFPVDVISTSADLVKGNAIYKLFLYSNTNFYRGFRVLCLGNPTIQVDGTYFGYSSGSASTAKDVNGNLIKNSILQYDGKQWVVLYTAQTNLMCSVIYEGLVYQYDTTIPGAWGAIGGFDQGNDCFHPYSSITQVAGVETDPTFILNNNTAVQVKYTWTATNIPVIPSKNIANYYSFGAWLNFRFPFPHNNVNPTGLNVGLLYGGSINTGQEPATLDSQNMHYTHDGLRGFNNFSAEDFGQLASLNFDMKLEYQDFLTGLNIVGEANFKMRCFIIDTEDNVVYQDFVIPFNGNFEAVELPLSGFAIYRGLQPLWGPLDVIIPPAQVSATNVFNWRNIKNICIQTQESYDDSGRYNPETSRWNRVTLAGFSRQIKLTIDSFRFAKPLLAITAPVGDRLIQPDFLQRPSILFYDQLLSDAKAELEKSKFRHKEYDVTTTMAFDINFGDSFYLNNPRIISDSDNGANTIKLVAKKIEYSITKAENGQGGALRTIVGIKRFS